MFMSLINNNNNYHNKKGLINNFPLQLKQKFYKQKIKLNLLTTLKDGDKIGKTDEEYYIFENKLGQQWNRWWYNENRNKTIDYLDKDFISYMQFLDELCYYLEKDVLKVYFNFSEEIKEYNRSLIQGLYKLKDTYKNGLKEEEIKKEKIIVKIDSIILTLLDFKENVNKYIAINEYNLSTNSEPFTKNNFYTFVTNIFLLQTFLYEYTFNTPSWSISAEFYTYLLFAILIIFKFNLRISLFVLLLISLIRINDQSNFGASHSGYRSFIDCIYSFYWGLFSSYLYIKFNNKKLYKITKNLISFILLIVTFFSLTKMQNDYLFILPIIFSLLIFFHVI